MSRNKKSNKTKRLVFISTIFAISILALIFIIKNFQDNIVFFYSPSELKTVEILEKSKNKQIRVGGLVKENTVHKIDAITTEFVITDLEKELEINYIGILPELFREGQGIVVKGKFDIERDKFFSEEMLVKHDENYMPPEVKNSLKY